MDKNTQQTMFSHKSDEFETPLDFYHKLDRKYHFTLDPCATKQNAKCSKFYTIQDDGLKQDWQGEVVFVNPPYSKNKDWIKKCYEEGQKLDTTVVVLIPSRTDTKYWHDYIMKAQEIHFVKGRLKFGNEKNCAPFPSAVVIFSSNQLHSTNDPWVLSLEK